MRLIDADALKQQFVDKLVRVGLPSEKAEGFAKTAFDATFKIIDAMPTIEAVPKHYDTESWKTTTTEEGSEYAPVKHGRWIKSKKSDYNWECSNCGYGLTDYRTTYCYDCGAKMDLEEVENA